jgi:transcriptional regulator with XRE-family HTH domain
MIHPYSPNRLRSLRQRALLSQRDVERLTGISDATIAYLETGRHRPQSGTLRKLLFLYDLNIRRLERSEKLWRVCEEQIAAPCPIGPSDVPPREVGTSRR